MLLGESALALPGLLRPGSMLHRNHLRALRNWNFAPTQTLKEHVCRYSACWRLRGEHREAKMTVSTILADKGRDVVTIEPGANLADAVQLLTEKRIGAALILGADHRVVGIISERDIVRALAERGAAVLAEPVSQIMTRKVETCSENEPISNIMERMTEGKFRHVPVVAEGRLVGIVSIGDVVKHRVQQMERESAEMRDYILSA
jgi:CBS domain-containing protein